MMTLTCFLVCLASIAFFQYGECRYDHRMTNQEIGAYVLNTIINPFVIAGRWLKGFGRGAYKLFCKNAAPDISWEDNETERKGEFSFCIAALVTTALTIGLSGLGVVIGIGSALYEFFNK